MNKQLESILSFLESGLPPQKDAGLFGATLPDELASIIILGVPWDVTTSYGAGTAKAPELIRQASHQLDLEDKFFGQTYRVGIGYRYLEDVMRMGIDARAKAEKVIEQLEHHPHSHPDLKDLDQVNHASHHLNNIVYEHTKKILEQNKKFGIIGGDHSVPFGAIKALAESTSDSFGILHIDAHHDLRAAYEGFTHSHASIFYNVLSDPDMKHISELVSVGVRDFSKEEVDYSREERVTCFYDQDLADQKLAGKSWDLICDDILSRLPARVYISFDIDGLSQDCCPNTGTPVPGGLSFHEICHLLHKLKSANKKVLGFDLVEVGAGEWDANVGARLLYKLCGTLA